MAGSCTWGLQSGSFYLTKQPELTRLGVPRLQAITESREAEPAGVRVTLSRSAQTSTAKTASQPPERQEKENHA